MVRRFREYSVQEAAGFVQSPSMAETMVRSLVEITSGRQKEMYSAMLKDLRPVKCVPLGEVFTPEEIRTIRNTVRPKMKECYSNAYHFASRLDGAFGKPILYCEGYMDTFGLPVEHAFNKVGDLYVDITAELVLGDDVAKSEYSLIGEWDDRTALRAMALDGCYGCVYQKLYMKSHQDGITA